jgi:hypothetical protein
VKIYARIQIEAAGVRPSSIVHIRAANETTARVLATQSKQLGFASATGISRRRRGSRCGLGRLRSRRGYSVRTDIRSGRGCWRLRTSSQREK